MTEALSIMADGEIGAGVIGMVMDCAYQSLVQAGMWFREYEQGHIIKAKSDSDAEIADNYRQKAERNRDRAEYCEVAANAIACGSEYALRLRAALLVIAEKSSDTNAVILALEALR